MRNDRLLGVAAESRAYAEIRSMRDVPKRLLDEIEHFFVSYNEARGRRFRVLRPRRPRGGEATREGFAAALRVGARGDVKRDSSPVVFSRHDRLRVAPRRPARGSPSGRHRSPGRRAVSRVSGARRRRPRSPAGSAEVLHRSRSGAGAVRRAGAAGRRLRLLAPGSPRQLGVGGEPRRRQRASDDVGRCRRGARPGAGDSAGGGDRSRRDRVAARCRRRDRGPAAAPASAPHPEDPRGREPVERRQRSADLPAGGRSGRDEHVFPRHPGADPPARRGRQHRRRAPAVVARPHADEERQGRADLHHSPVHLRVRRVDSGRPSWTLERPHDGELRNRGGAAGAGAHAGAASPAVLRGLGHGRLPAQRAGVRLHRAADPSHPHRASIPTNACAISSSRGRSS